MLLCPRAGRGPVVGVGPVTIPGYLDRAAIVVRAAGDEVRLSEDHRWAESLKDGVARVVAENLAGMIPTDAIAVYPWKTPWAIQYRVAMEIMRFDGPLGGPSFSVRAGDCSMEWGRNSCCGLST